MLTIENLRAYGANVDEGMARCMGREDFYLRMVRMILADANIGKLRQAIDAGDLDAAFGAAHALKGVAANLSLTPIQAPVSEMTEFLRARTQMDYQPLMGRAEAAWAELKALAE